MALRDPLALTSVPYPQAGTCANPHVELCGPGPAGCRCGGCSYLAAIPEHLRDEGGPRYYCVGTDEPIRATWPSCSGYREAPLAT